MIEKISSVGVTDVVQGHGTINVWVQRTNFVRKGYFESCKIFFSSDVEERKLTDVESWNVNPVFILVR